MSDAAAGSHKQCQITHLRGQGSLCELFERGADVDKVLHDAANQRVLDPVPQLLQLGRQLPVGTENRSWSLHQLGGA